MSSTPKCFPPKVRRAAPAESALLARLINDAFVVEAFFKIGNRTSETEILELMKHGEFLVAEDSARRIVGCVYLEIQKGRTYFGMLSIDPSEQGRGYGRALIEAVESMSRERGSRAIDIHIVNLREDMQTFYGRLGYLERGTLPFSQPDRASRPCHFIVMTKELAGQRDAGDP